MRRSLCGKAEFIFILFFHASYFLLAPAVLSWIRQSIEFHLKEDAHGTDTPRPPSNAATAA